MILKYTKFIFNLLLWVYCCGFSQEQLPSVTNTTIVLDIEEGKALLKNNQLPEAQHLFEKAYDTLMQQADYPNRLSLIASIYDNLGIIERRRSNYDKALQFLLKSLHLKEKAKDSMAIGTSYHIIAKLYTSKNEYRKALDYIRRAMPLRKKDSSSYGFSLRDYGKLLYLTKNYSDAAVYLDSAKFYFKNAPVQTADVNAIYANIYKQQQNYIKALRVLKNNVTVFKNYKEVRKKANTYIDLAKVYRSLSQHKRALKYLDSAYDIHEAFENKKIVSEIYFERYLIYENEKNYQKALENLSKHKQLSDTVFNLAQLNKVAQLEIAYENDKKEAIQRLVTAAKEQQLLEVAKRQRMQKLLYASLLLLAVLVTMFVYWRSKSKQKIQEKSIRQKQLEADLLNEKTASLQYRIDTFLANDQMKIDFKDSLIEKLKQLKNKTQSYQSINEYQSILLELEHQQQTENRIDTLTHKHSKKNADDFVLKLAKNYPSLTKSEREICHLIYLNLSAKEIMNVRNVTLSSVKSTRYRIRKKMNIPKEVELELFIQNLLREATFTKTTKELEAK